MKQVTLELRNGVKFYVSGREITRALSDINICVWTGEFVAVIGESGSGKSTLAHILAGVLPADKGTVYINGTSTLPYGEPEWEAYRRDMVSFVAQNYGILPGYTVLDNVVSALLVAGLTKKQARVRAEQLLRQVELWKYKNRRAARLSSGQKQRLSVARAVAKPAPVLIADEPTSNLDAENSEKIVALLKEEAKTRLVIMVTHDVDMAKAYATRLVELKNGEVVKNEIISSAVTEQKEPVSWQTDAISKQQELQCGRYLAGRMLKARPIWSMLMLALFSMTAFAVFAFLGTFFSVLDDSATKYYKKDAFYNGSNKRLAVVRQDGNPMTEYDYESILALSFVESVEPYGLLTDVNYYYRENMDYSIAISNGNGMGSSAYTETVRMENDTLFMQTIPRAQQMDDFLTAGRLPKQAGEVVVSGTEEWLGKSFSVYIQDRKEWTARKYIKEEVTVVGVTNQGDGLFFYGTPELVQSIYTEVSEEEALCQASVFLKNYSYTNRVKKQLEKLGYEVISPYQMGTIVQNSELAGQRMMTLVLCILALLLVLSMQLIVAGLLFGTETADYKQLRNLGLPYRSGVCSICRQIAMLTVAGWLVCGIVVGVLAAARSSLLQNIWNYLEFYQVIFFAFVHGLAAILLAAVVIKNLKQQVFCFLPKGLEPELSELAEEGGKRK